MKDFKRGMIELAPGHALEEAQKIEKIEVLENYQSRSTVQTKKSPISVFSIVSDESGWLCKFSQISHGSIIRHT
jgi:hypothetical protein